MIFSAGRMMSRSSKWKIVFCLIIFFGLCSTVTTNEEFIENMSLEERRSFFETEDGSVPEFQLVELKKTSRSKRAATLNIDMRDFNTGLITVATVYLVPDQQLISRSTTGLWFAEYSKTAYHGVTYLPQPDVLARIGDLELFQNVDECSAVTRFRNEAGYEVISGVLRQDYSVKSIPRGAEDGYVNIVRRPVGRRSVNSTQDQVKDSPLVLVIFKNPKVPEKYLRIRRHAQNSSLPEFELHRRKRENAGQYTAPRVVYPKVLVTPDYSVISKLITIDDLVRELITHFNAVDMVYRQLNNPAVRLKIAGIIVPMDEFATPYIAPNTVKVLSIIANNVLDRTRQYFLEEEYRFPFNTYDTIVMLTKNNLLAIDNGGLASIVGQAVIGSGCFIGRAITTYNRGFVGVVNLAHELGHVFNVFDAPATRCPDNEGFIMGSSIGAVRMLRWSRCSYQEFSSYFSSPQASCMHNRPFEKPLSVVHLQGTWMPLHGQCDNYVYAPNTVPCSTSYPDGLRPGCSTDSNTCVYLNDFPMEGTELLDGSRWINHQPVFIK